MVKIFKHYIPLPILLLGGIELAIVTVSVYTGIFLRYVLGAEMPWGLAMYLPEALTFSAILGFAMFALGLYQREYLRDMRTVFVRLATSFTVAFLGLSLVFYVFPDLKIWRSALAIAIVFAVFGILSVRFAVARTAQFERFKRRILVIGAGRNAARLFALERDGGASFSAVGYLPIGNAEPAVPSDRLVAHIELLPALVEQRQIDEIVVAIEDWRGTLPTEALLEAKLNGINVVHYTTFWERETGAVDHTALNPSWLIFSDGFGGNTIEAAAKRLFDIATSFFILIFTLPLLLATAIVIRLESHGPIFYRQERVGRGGRSFMLIKFRSMCIDAEKGGMPLWAAKNDARVTRFGAIIRKARIDEIPQIFNVLKGDMSLVGPRPERPFFVEQLTERIPYYRERHRVKPGITGWAQLNYSYGASVGDAMRKLEYDLYYLKNYSVMLDLIILVQTVRVVLWPDSVTIGCSPAAVAEVTELNKRSAA
ncbi:MAG: TIGR03013 family XrtA/PEP-CTERM system glycosyltransferase [Alphaproteobacteria bacterium]